MSSALPVIESCLTCPSRESGLFCRLTAETLHHLVSIRRPLVFHKGATLFAQGEWPRGLFILCSGRARLMASSGEGRSTTLDFVQPGEALGLSALLSNAPYAATAEVLAPSQVAFIPRPQFLKLLQTQPEVGLRVAEHLSVELQRAWEQIRLLSLASKARIKLARLLLSWAERHGRASSAGLPLRVALSQEEIGQSIGVSRETVSRLLAAFKQRRWIRVRPREIVLLRPEKLRQLALKE